MSFYGSIEQQKQFEKRRQGFEDERLEKERKEVEMRQRIAAGIATHEKEQRQEAARQLEAGLKAAFLATPGTTEEDWERNRQTILDNYRNAQALAPAPNVFEQIRSEAAAKQAEHENRNGRIRGWG